MNSFWIPQLGGQIYAMPGMSTHLNLMASQVGIYRGSSANLSGNGFAGMVFNTRASSRDEFDAWVGSTRHSENSLNQAEYDKLAMPSSYNKLAFYTLADAGLYDRVVMKYMSPVVQPVLSNLNYQLMNNATY